MDKITVKLLKPLTIEAGMTFEEGFPEISWHKPVFEAALAIKTSGVVFLSIPIETVDSFPDYFEIIREKKDD